MGDIVRISNLVGMENGIDVARVSEYQKQLKTGIIQPATEYPEVELAEDRASDPIKNVNDINRISEYLIERHRYRDNMMFIVGINFGLRVSDLLTLRFSSIINDDFTFKTTFPILEKKTKNTRKVRKNRYITINEAVMESVVLYLQNHKGTKLDDFMFKSESNRGSNINRAMSRKSVDMILKEIGTALNLDIHIATHTLRKTFGYHQMMMSGNDPRKLLILQKMFGHSSSMQTLEYIGLTGEEIQDAYRNLNLGSKNCYQKFNALYESAKEA